MNRQNAEESGDSIIVFIVVGLKELDHNLSIRARITTFQGWWLLNVPPGLTQIILRSAHTVYFCDCYGSGNQQRIFPPAKLTEYFFYKPEEEWQFFFYQLDAQILYFNTFITLLYMFRALLCSSSGGQLY